MPHSDDSIIRTLIDNHFKNQPAQAGILWEFIFDTGYKWPPFEARPSDCITALADTALSALCSLRPDAILTTDDLEDLADATQDVTELDLSENSCPHELRIAISILDDLINDLWLDINDPFGGDELDDSIYDYDPDPALI